MKPLIARNQAEHKLYTLTAEWQRSNELARKAIAQNIQDHPEWNLIVGTDGPALKPQQTSPLALVNDVKEVQL